MGIAMKDFREFAFETSLERQEFAKQRVGEKCQEEETAQVGGSKGALAPQG